jgi:hypothetical protein
MVNPYRMQHFLNFIIQAPIQLIPQSILSSFTNSNDGDDGDDGDDNNKDKSPYYDCVYLCMKYDTDIKYKCIKFDSYEKAEEYYKSVYSHRANNFIKKLIPLCSYTPLFLHNMILDFKLKNKLL